MHYKILLIFLIGGMEFNCRPYKLPYKSPTSMRKNIKIDSKSRR